MKKHMITVLAAAIIATVLVLLPAYAQADQQTVRPSTAGQLQVVGTQLCDENGNPVVLKGMSTHGIRWFPEFVNEGLFSQLSDEWGANVVRLAMYSADYCASAKNAEENLAILRTGIDAAIANDMYVLVDWHILEDNDPNTHIEEALAFFELISSEYAGVPNVLYEICNEPNGEVTWTNVRAYAERVIPEIRANSPEAVIIVGTPTYDRDLTTAMRNPLDFDNIMYTLHFYAATHGEDLREELVTALDAGLPVFVTECGISESSGDGRVDFDSAVAWFDLLAERNVSYIMWSLSNKAESSAFIRPRAQDPAHLTDDDLTPVGLWGRSLLQGEEPASIARPAVDEQGYFVAGSPDWMETLSGRDVRSAVSWPRLALGAAALMAVGTAFWWIYRIAFAKKHPTYDDLLKIGTGEGAPKASQSGVVLRQAVILTSTFFTLVYLAWRVFFSVPFEGGWLAVAACFLLFAVEALGFVESLVHYESMIGLREHPLPKIADEDYPDVDIFISTYNEPCDLLRRTINGCTRMRYPDKSKVHIWVCDDNRRPAMRALAEEMGVGYFDRPDNKGAKAGNLNHALSLTSAPYVVTFDADMIPRSDFLLKTIPYFVDAEQRCSGLPDDEKIRLGLLQSPQAFYDPDVFQHALYSEHRVPNEQDFFYRTIEPAKTSTNSVIYGGSNTVLSRAALEEIGGFYTESITEDFATGMLIESAGFVSLAIPEPLASGRTPDTYREHIQQRTRWGRGVIVTARKLHVLTRPGLSLSQRLSYWSSVVYWYSPIKNLIYVCAPLVFAVFAVPVLACSWLDLFEFWLPMFIAQNVCLRVVGNNAISSRWSGIYETSVMPHLLVPIVKEALGISLTAFKVTDKSGSGKARQVDKRAMMPFVVLLALSLIGFVRVVWLLAVTRSVGLAVLLFWILRNAYYLVMALFLADGRDSDGEPVHVMDTVPLVVRSETGAVFEGVTTHLTEHSVKVFLDECEGLALGDRLELELDTGDYRACVSGVLVGVAVSRTGVASVYTIEILDYGTDELEYLQIIYDRVPSLPQRMTYDFGVLGHLWRNIAFRVARSVQ